METVDTNKCCSYLGGLVVRRAEAFDGDLSEDVGLHRLLSQVAVINDGWMPEKKKKSSHWFYNLEITLTICVFFFFSSTFLSSLGGMDFSDRYILCIPNC